VASAFQDLSQKSQPPARFDYFDGVFVAGSHGAGVLRIPTADGDNPFMLLRYRRLRGLFASGIYWERRLKVDHPASPLLNMLSVGYISGFQTPPEAALLAAGLEKAGEVHANRIYRNPRALPRFFLPPRVRRSADEDDTFLDLADPAFDPAAEAIVEGISSDRNGLAVAPVRTDSWEENRIALTVTTSGPAFLATSEILYPGWTATVNGTPQPLLMTNGAFRGLFLGAGTSHIEMRYRPMSLVAGALISLASLLPALWFAGRGWTCR
ncbi:MAG TPA: YfhO family protein, partial [Bryobacteraceae bacterium]|nr:YfhO family protein [Bryobacteraceae bacterium]